MATLGEGEKQRILNEYMKSPSGRAKLAHSMIQPLRTRMDYGRRCGKCNMRLAFPDSPHDDVECCLYHVMES